MVVLVADQRASLVELDGGGAEMVAQLVATRGAAGRRGRRVDDRYALLAVEHVQRLTLQRHVPADVVLAVRS